MKSIVLHQHTAPGTDGRNAREDASRQPATLGRQPLGLYINALVVDPSDPRSVFAGSADAGIVASSDGGSTWRTSGPSIQSDRAALTIQSLALDPHEPSVLHAGSTHHGPLRSQDGGASWKAQQPALDGVSVIALAPDPHIPGRLYAATPDGVLKSSDGARSWQTTTPLRPCRHVLALATGIAPGELFAGLLDGGVLRSSDGGTTWAQTTAGLDDRTVLALVPADPGCGDAGHGDAGRGAYAALYAGTASGIFWFDGQRWHAADSQLAKGFIHCLVAHPKDPATLLAGTARDGVLLSEDAGIHWRRLDGGRATRGVRALAVAAGDPMTLYAGTAGDGVLRSRDGGKTWHPRGALPRRTAT